MSDALSSAGDAVMHAQERMVDVRAGHTSLGKTQDDLNDLHSKLSAAVAEGDRDAARSFVDGIGNALRQAQSIHKDLGVTHDALDRSLDAARLAVQGARDAGDGGYVNPTKEMAENDAGGMTSDGPSGNGVDGTLPPRDYSPEAIRERDQRNAVDAAYRRKIDAIRNRH